MKIANNYWAVINLHVRKLPILFKSVLVGILAGIVVCAYRYTLIVAEEWSGFIALQGHLQAIPGIFNFGAIGYGWAPGIPL